MEMKPDPTTDDKFYGSFKESCMVLSTNKKVHEDMIYEMNEHAKTRLSVYINEVKPRFWKEKRMPPIKTLPSKYLKKSLNNDSDDGPDKRFSKQSDGGFEVAFRQMKTKGGLKPPPEDFPIKKEKSKPELGDVSSIKLDK